MTSGDDNGQNDIDKILNSTSNQTAIDDLFGPNATGGSAPNNTQFAGGDAKYAPSEKGPETHELEAVYDVPVQISAVLGRSVMPVHQLLKLGRGAVVELDRRVGEAIDIYVNNRLVARGEVVVVDDHLGVTMTEIIKSERS